MIAIPAVDIRDGVCVQLVGGAYDAERVRLPDAVAVADRWAAQGFARLHVVDLDAATGRGSNEGVVRDILAAGRASIQVGGGVRGTADIRNLLAAGATSVVLGTRAIEEPAWLAAVARTFPDRITVAADVRDRRVVTHGWERTHDLAIEDLVEAVSGFPLAALLVTAVHREGQLRGTDVSLMEDVVQRSTHPVIASGGITTMSELRALAERGVAAAVIGMALYTGALDARAVANEFGGKSNEQG